MSTTVARLEAILSANTRDFDRAMDKSEGRMGKVGKTAKVAGLAVAGGLAVGIEKSVHAAIDAQASHARLEKAFQTAHLSADKYKQSVDEAESASRKLGFTDEDVRGSLGSLLVATDSYAKSRKDLNVAEDIARFKGINLESATKMLTMAMGGSQRAAKQLGLSVQAVTTSQDAARSAFTQQKDAINAQYAAMGKLTPAEEKQKQAALDNAQAQYDGAKATAQVKDHQVTAGKVIDLVSVKLHGQAKAYSETAAGGMAQFNAQVQHLEVEVGTKLLPALTKTVGELNSLTVWMDRLNERFKFQIEQLRTIKPLWANIGYFINIAAGDIQDLVGWLGKLEGGEKKVLQLANGLEKVAHWAGTAVNAVKDLIGILGKIHVPHISIPGIHGDPIDPNLTMPTGTGPSSINSKLWADLQLGKSDGLVLSSGYRPGAVTKHGTKSDHSYYPSKAIDMAGSASNMARFFLSLIGHPEVKQAFYDPLGSIFAGARSSYREGGHSDHVHVATYDKGGWLRPGWNLAFNGLGRPEAVGGAPVTIPVIIGGDEIARVVWDPLRRAAKIHKRRTGRSPF